MTTTDEPGAAPPGHQCAVPELDPGQQWTCPDPACGQTYGQQMPPPGSQVVNVGAVLQHIGDACIQVGHAMARGVPPEQIQAAFYQLGGQFAWGAQVFARYDVVVPLPPNGSGM